MEKFIRVRLESKNEADLKAILDFCKIKEQKAKNAEKEEGTMLAIIWEARIELIEGILLGKINNIF